MRLVWSEGPPQTRKDGGDEALEQGPSVSLYIKALIFLLKPYCKIQKEWEQLPEEICYEVFGYFVHWPKTLMTLRVVCSSWKVVNVIF